MAYLAALPKGPNNYHPFRHPKRAIERRNWVLLQMFENGYITEAEMKTAQAKAADRQSAPLRRPALRCRRISPRKCAAT
jgi:membrane carboxypeptidase/penicillin-binding protein